VALDHPLLVRGEPHPDDRDAFCSVVEPDIVVAMERGWLEETDDISASLDDSLVLIGSPEAEAVTQLAFGYERKTDKSGVYALGNVIDLPYCWLEDPAKVEAQSWKYVEGYHKPVARPNWPVVSNVGGKQRLLFPELRNDGLIATDYLLITKVPNYLTRIGYQSGHSVVSIAGTHGIGTRAVSVLLRDRNVLAAIGRTIPAESRAFQVLLRASSVRHEQGKSSSASRIELIDVQIFDRTDYEWMLATHAVAKNQHRWLENFRSASS
jgi:hypothetical protein